MCNFYTLNHEYNLDLHSQHIKVCKYLNSTLEEMIASIDPKDREKLKSVKEKHLGIETNLWSAIDRIISFNLLEERDTTHVCIKDFSEYQKECHNGEESLTLHIPKVKANHRGSVQLDVMVVRQFKGPDYDRKYCKQHTGHEHK